MANNIIHCLLSFNDDDQVEQECGLRAFIMIFEKKSQKQVESIVSAQTSIV